MKKLIPALCLLLITAALMGTSTFAWFSMNNTVSADGMSVKATTTGANLYIAKGASVAVTAITGTSVADLGVSATSVVPAHMSDSSGTVTVQTVKDYKTGKTPTPSTAGEADTYNDQGTLSVTTASVDLSGYCAYGFVSIARKQETAGTYSLTPSCTVTFGTDTALNKALRCGIIMNGALYESNDADTASGEATFTFSAITGLSDNTAYSACLVMWFEGADSDCTANNAVTLSTNTASWSFSAS